MKRIIAVSTALIMLIIVSAFAVNAEESYEFGDVNKDGVISITDATDIQRHLAGYITLDDEAAKLADVDNDKDVSIMDATSIQMFLARYIEDFPANNVTPTTPPTDADGFYDQIVKP